MAMTFDTNDCQKFRNVGVFLGRPFYHFGWYIVHIQYQCGCGCDLLSSLVYMSFQMLYYQSVSTKLVIGKKKLWMLSETRLGLWNLRYPLAHHFPMILFLARIFRTSHLDDQSYMASSFHCTKGQPCRWYLAWTLGYIVQIPCVFLYSKFNEI